MLGRLLGRTPEPTPDPDAELRRAARVLAIRSRRAAGGVFAGRYRAAFRGTGMEFEESRPYVPGDDPRRMDWNAMARTGEPFVKRFREERGRTLQIALDVSASMAFGSGPRSKAVHAANLAALLASAAGQAGDRVGFLAFDEKIRADLRPNRGPAHAWRVVEAAAQQGRAPSCGTDWSVALGPLALGGGPRAVIFLLSDFRASGIGADPTGAGRLAGLAERHDVVCAVVEDLHEQLLPAVGSVRLLDPERPDRSERLRTSSASVRSRYKAAALARRRALTRSLQAAGASVLLARTDHDPLRTLIHFFDERAARGRHVRP